MTSSQRKDGRCGDRAITASSTELSSVKAILAAASLAYSLLATAFYFLLFDSSTMFSGRTAGLWRVRKPRCRCRFCCTSHSRCCSAAVVVVVDAVVAYATVVAALSASIVAAATANASAVAVAEASSSGSTVSP